MRNETNVLAARGDHAVRNGTNVLAARGDHALRNETNVLAARGDHAVRNETNVLVTRGDHAEATHKQVNLSNIQDEANTKLILNSLNATPKGATSVRVHSSDTDVVVLAARHPNLREVTAWCNR